MFCRFNYSQNEWIKEKKIWKYVQIVMHSLTTVRFSAHRAEHSSVQYPLSRMQYRPSRAQYPSAERNTSPAECSTPSACICSCLWSLWSYRWIWSQGYFRQQGFCHDLLSHGLYRHYCCTSRNQFIKVRNVPCKTGTENWGSFYLVYICSYNTVPRLDCIPDFTGYYMGNKDNFFLPDLLRQG